MGKFFLPIFAFYLTYLLNNLYKFKNLIFGGPMKKLFFLVIFLSFNSIYSQNNIKESPFSAFELGVYGGINFESISESRGTFLIEGKTNLFKYLFLKFSVGYYKTHKIESYTARNYKEFSYDSLHYFQAIKYDVVGMEYDVFPFMIGFQYIFKNKYISPYLLFDISYNLIDPVMLSENGHVWQFDSYDEIPEEFRTVWVKPKSTSSYGLTIGTGLVYKLTEGLDLDLRYLYKYDSEIVNTHHILVGIVF